MNKCFQRAFGFNLQVIKWSQENLLPNKKTKIKLFLNEYTGIPMHYSRLQFQQKMSLKCQKILSLFSIFLSVSCWCLCCWGFSQNICVCMHKYMQHRLKVKSHSYHNSLNALSSVQSCGMSASGLAQSTHDWKSCNITHHDSLNTEHIVKCSQECIFFPCVKVCDDVGMS